MLPIDFRGSEDVEGRLDERARVLPVHKKFIRFQIGFIWIFIFIQDVLNAIPTKYRKITLQYRL